MELAAVKSVDARGGNVIQRDIVIKENAEVKTDKIKAEAVNVSGKDKKQDINKEDLHNMTEQMNKFMELLNADLKFALHERTNTLMVQVVSTKDQRVLKEFPPKEFLDTIANIRDYVGFLLDEKA